MGISMAASRGGMARYNSVGKQKQKQSHSNSHSHSHSHSPLSSSTHSSTSNSTSTSTLTKSVRSNIPPSTASAPASPAPGLRRHIPETNVAAKVPALDAKPLKSALESECEALRAANAAMATEVSALRKRLEKKEAECRALEEALLCVARTSEAARKQKERDKVEKEKESGTKHREWNYD